MNNNLAKIRQQAKVQLDQSDGFFLIILDKDKYAHHLYFGSNNSRTGDIIMHTEALLEAIKSNIIEKVNTGWFGKQLNDSQENLKKDKSYFG